jgi:hypothetical protein
LATRRDHIALHVLATRKIIMPAKPLNVELAMSAKLSFFRRRVRRSGDVEVDQPVG